MRHKCHRLGRFMRVVYIHMRLRRTCETDIVQHAGKMAKGDSVNGVSNNPNNIARCLPYYHGVTLYVYDKMRPKGWHAYLISRVKL